MKPRNAVTTPRIAWRAVWVQIHLWLGLTLGVVGALLGLSGSILVYDEAIDAWMNPQRHAVTGTEAPLAIAEYALRAELALANGARATALRLPDQEGGPVMVFLRARGDAAFQRAYLDPPTGRVLDMAGGRDLLGWLHDFHESLALREYKGREIVGVVGIGMLISSLSGIYLWWPAGRWRRSTFGFRPGFALHRSLHYTIGFWGAIVLAMLSLTGIFLAYADAGRAVVGLFAKVSPSPRAVQVPEGSGRPMPPDDAVALAREAVPNARVIGFGFPGGPRGAYRVNLREADDTTSRSGTVVYLDPRSRAIVNRIDRASRGSGDTFLLWQRILHEGSAGGPVGRFVTFLGGLMPPTLMVTGLLMWLRARRRDSARATATATAATAADAR